MCNYSPPLVQFAQLAGTPPTFLTTCNLLIYHYTSEPLESPHASPNHIMLSCHSNSIHHIVTPTTPTLQLQGCLCNSISCTQTNPPHHFTEAFESSNPWTLSLNPQHMPHSTLHTCQRWPSNRIQSTSGPLLQHPLVTGPRPATPKLWIADCNASFSSCF